MRIKVIILGYGGKPLHIAFSNVERSGYPYYDVDVLYVYGIANAMNAGISRAMDGLYDAVAFLANDITEPDGWLKAKVEYLKNNQGVGICSIPVDEVRRPGTNEDLIGNYLIDMDVVNKVGAFNYEFHPYGPVDLDYCHRTRVAGFKTSYVPDLLAHHPHPHGGEDPAKREMVDRFWPVHVKNVREYDTGEKSIFIPFNHQPNDTEEEE